MSNIKENIKELIISDLVNTVYPKTSRDVVKYRDKYFLSGHYDYIFEDFIKEKNLK